MINTCNNTITDKIVVVSENKKEFRIYNQSCLAINKVKVDNCYIKEGLKCDFLFEILTTSLKDILNVLYVELKGSDISHAILQLESTINRCNQIHNNIDKKCYIVASKVPSSGTSSQILKKQFIKKNNIQLFIDTKEKEVYI